MLIIAAIPNIIWMMIIFLILRNDNIENTKKILYLLVAQFIFLSMTMISNQILLNENNIEIMTTIVEILDIIIIAYWTRKNYKNQTSHDTNIKKYYKIAIIGFIICILLIALLYFILI